MPTNPPCFENNISDLNFGCYHTDKMLNGYYDRGKRIYRKQMQYALIMSYILVTILSIRNLWVSRHAVQLCFNRVSGGFDI